MNIPQLERISINPAIMGGKPCLGQTRVTVGTITGLVASEVSFDEILRLYPYLTRDDIHAALLYAAWRAEEQEIELQNGALVTIHPRKTRISFLPLARKSDSNDPPAIPFQE